MRYSPHTILILTAVIFFAVPVSAFALNVDSSNYDPGETINVTCGITNHAYQLFDITPGIDGQAGSGGNIGIYNCSGDQSLSFSSLNGHTYSIFELSSAMNCEAQDYDQCGIQYYVWAEVNFTVGAGATPGSVGSASLPLSTNKATYDVSEVVTVSCGYHRGVFEVYDITQGSAANMGLYECSNSTITIQTFDAHTYAVIELTYGGNCESITYDDCSTADFSRDEISFNVVQGSGGGGGGGGSQGEGLSKTTYAPGESISLTCQVSIGVFQLYDISPGIDGVVASGGGLTAGMCGTPATFSFNSSPLHSYAIVELTNGSSCSGLDYDTCLQQSYARTTYFFSVSAQQAGRRVISQPPVVKLLAPTTSAVFSKNIVIKYSATDQNDIDPPEIKAQLGLGTTPVSIYYSDKIDSWDHSYVLAEDKILIANRLAATGTYAWDISQLTPGVQYRIIVDAMDLGNNLTEQVSEPFTVDFTSPQFIVTADPAVTRGQDVTISVESNEKLQKPPRVLVTQEGGSAISVAMELQDEAYQGIYKVIPGQDGIAHITVEGIDLAGNISTSTVSGGTFAVGVNPPPTPRILLPHKNDIVSTSTIVVSGTSRPEMVILVTVNGKDTYTVTTGKDGTFTVPNVRLSKVINRGLNTISVVAKDKTEALSAAATLQIKYNAEPTIALVSPALGAVLRGISPIVASSTDANGDPLRITYQIIAEKDYDAAQEKATTSKNSLWVTISESAVNKFSWDTTEVEDGNYFVRVFVDDGIAKAFSESRRFTVRNTLPFFRFEDGRKTIVARGPVTVAGRVLEPAAIPGATISTLEYSVDNGRTWKSVKIVTGQTEARFSVTFPDFETEGTYGVLWRAKDSRGLTGRTSHPVIIDATAPKPPVIVAPRRGAVLTDADDENTFVSGLQISVTVSAEPQSKITFAVNGATSTARADIDGSATFRGVTLTARGAYSFSVSATDEVGNSSGVASRTYVYDNPPEISFLEPKASRGLQGIANVSWRIVDTDNDSVRAILSYRKGQGQFIALPTDPSRNTFAWDVSTFSQGGDYELRLSANDGLATSTATIGFFIDKVPPAVNSFSLERNMIGASAVLAGRGVATDALSGIEYVEYAIVPESRNSDKQPEWFTALITKGFLRQQASFSLRDPVSLSDGTYELLLRAVDAAGNTSTQISKQFTVDTLPPRIGSFTATTNNAVISPDKKGAIAVYPDSTVTFGVSLEEDTVAASVQIAEVQHPLKYDIASGLWLGTDSMMISTSSAICVSAEDELHNGFSNKCIGSFEVTPRGQVFTVQDALPQPVKGAKIKVLVSSPEKNSFEPFVSTLMNGEITTAPDGSYELILPEGSYRLIVTAPGYRTLEKDIVVAQSAPISTAYETEKLSALQTFIQNITDYFRSIQ